MTYGMVLLIFNGNYKCRVAKVMKFRLLVASWNMRGKEMWGSSSAHMVIAGRVRKYRQLTFGSRDYHPYYKLSSLAFFLI